MANYDSFIWFVGATTIVFALALGLLAIAALLWKGARVWIRDLKAAIRDELLTEGIKSWEGAAK